MPMGLCGSTTAVVDALPKARRMIEVRAITTSLAAASTVAAARVPVTHGKAGRHFSNGFRGLPAGNGLHGVMLAARHGWTVVAGGALGHVGTDMPAAMDRCPGEHTKSQ